MWKVWRGPYIMDYLNCKQLKKKKEERKRSFFVHLKPMLKPISRREKCTVWFVLDTKNKGAILPSDSSSLLHDILPTALLCQSRPEIRDLVLLCFALGEFFYGSLHIHFSAVLEQRAKKKWRISWRYIFNYRIKCLLKYSRHKELIKKKYVTSRYIKLFKALICAKSFSGNITTN